MGQGLAVTCVRGSAPDEPRTLDREKRPAQAAPSPLEPETTAQLETPRSEEADCSSAGASPREAGVAPPASVADEAALEEAPASSIVAAPAAPLPVAPSPATVATRKADARAPAPARGVPAWRAREEALRAAPRREVEVVRQAPHAERGAHTDWAQLAAPVIAWLVEVTGAPIVPGVADAPSCDEAAVRAHLKSGVVLCELANRVLPGSVAQVSRSAAPFRQRENIANFLGAAARLGVHGHELFQTADLFEEHGDLRQVVVCLAAFGRAAHGVESYDGPSFGKPARARLGAHKSSATPLSFDVGTGLWATAAGQHRLAGPAERDFVIVRPASATGFAAPTSAPAA